MLRPLLLDLLEWLWPVLAGGVMFVLGVKSPVWRAWLRRVALGSATLVVALLGLDLGGVMPLHLGPILYHLGGPKVAICFPALFLLGVAWSTPQRSFSNSFLEFLAGVCALIILIEASGSMYWRFLAVEPWSRTVNAEGCLGQSTSMTCGPVAAVMLLHHHGIAASEGELAYLARTSFFGSDPYALSQAIARKLDPNAMHIAFTRTDYLTCLQRNLPFVATVRTGNVFAHAILVECIGADSVLVNDPGQGSRTRMTRRDFEQRWNGEAIHILGR